MTTWLTLVLQGHSAGAWSVSLAITRRKPGVTPPFRAGIMLSGEKVSTSPVLNFSIFDAFAAAMGCGKPPGPERLQCLRNVPASTIRAYTNGPNSGLFTPGVDKYVFYPTQEEVLISLVAQHSLTTRCSAFARASLPMCPFYSGVWRTMAPSLNIIRLRVFLHFSQISLVRLQAPYPPIKFGHYTLG